MAESVIKKAIPSYKNTGYKPVSSAATISDSWSEGDIVIRIGGSDNYSFTIHVLHGVNGVYYIGSSIYNKCCATISLSGNTVTVNSVWWYESDRMSDSIFIVYYR